MSILLDSSELREAARLIGALLRPQSVPPPPVPPAPIVPPLPSLAVPLATVPAPQPEAPPSAVVPVVPAPPPQTFRFRGEQLEHALATMCRRGDLAGAVVADRRGFALAVHNSPVDDDAIAAFTTVLGDALEKAATLLGEHGAENISMDINYTDKVVLRRFSVDGLPYFIMVICPQHVDERSEVEISIDQITTILMS